MTNPNTTQKTWERFEELEFATNPTETKGVLWRWNKHGKEVIKAFLTDEIAKAKLRGGFEAINMISEEEGWEDSKEHYENKWIIKHTQTEGEDV